MIRYCTQCLYPETKPDLQFSADGVCSACTSFAARQAVDWDKRAEEFRSILKRFRSDKRDGYDCLVPVSGGKDSTYQVVRLLEHGLNPLCVTATTDSLSEIGRRNLDNLISLGVDHISVTPNPVIRRRINKLALQTVGDISWPEHVVIFTIPVRTAVAMGIRLIVWGENPQNEYGGPAAATRREVLDRSWLEEFGGLLGLRVSDLAGQAGIEPHHLLQYTYPSNEELQRAGVTGLFLGYYFPWDGLSNYLIAQAHGFADHGTNIEGSLGSYENLDNYQTGIHDYFKFLKYGFGRATDIACNQIRRGRLGRKDAFALVQRHDGKFPWTYLGRRIEAILAEIDMTIEDFNAICDRFTNKRLFVRDNLGNLARDPSGNLIKINCDNP